MPFSWYLPTGSCVGDSALWSDASGSGIAFQRLLVDYDIRSLYAADRRSVCRSYRHWSSHADTFILLFMGTAQADQRAFLHGIFSHAAGFQKQIVHGHLSFIIDEQDAAGVYYLPLLTDISGWISPKKKAGKWKMLSFADGRTFEVSEHEAEAAKEMLSYASNRLYAQKVTGENRNNIPDAKETWNPLINPATTIYQKLVKIFLGLMVILFMMSYQILK